MKQTLFLTRFVAALCALVWLRPFSAPAADSSHSQFHQDRFAIGFWVDPPADDKMDERYREITNANFTFVLGVFGATTPDRVQRQMKLCEKYDLKAVASMAGLPPEKLPESPACWGYFLADEPATGAFSSLRSTVEKIRAARPEKLSFINLLPNYATPAQLGAASYPEYVSRFVSEVKPDILSMDYYPHFTPTADGRDGYCQNLEVMRAESVKAGIPFWNFFNTMPYGDQFDPTAAQLRWQIFTSLAYGAKGLMYFCYWTPSGAEFPKGGAILREDGTRTRQYGEARRLNAVVKNFGPTLMNLTSAGVIRLKRGADCAKPLQGSPVKSLTGGDYLIGVFKHTDGRRAVLINNYEFAYSAWPTVEFDVPTSQVVEVNPATGKEGPVYDDSPAMPGVQLSLDAGQGRLFLLPAK
ncbi:MAG TPA: hypothetical protein VHH88_13455 [Verrucomicrobiae bacterium]|nr:hypothetical protein [Verrucomicrobiae bacterium]